MTAESIYTNEVEEFEKVRKVRRFLVGLLQLSRAFEETLIDLVSAYTPWAAPLIPMVIGFESAQALPGFGFVGAAIYAVIVEFLGIATINTALEFRAWNANRTTDKAPLWLAVLAAVCYFAVVISVNVFLDTTGTDLQKGIKAGMSLLPIVSAITLGMRSEQAKRVKSVQISMDSAKLTETADQERADRLQREAEEREERRRNEEIERNRRFAVEDQRRAFEQAEIKKAKERAHEIKMAKLRGAPAPFSDFQKVSETPVQVSESPVDVSETFGKWRMWPDVPDAYKAEVAAFIKAAKAANQSNWKNETMKYICKTFGVSERVAYDWISYCVSDFPEVTA